MYAIRSYYDDEGFLLNDEMDDFTIKPGVKNLYGLVQGKANSIAPGKRRITSYNVCYTKLLREESGACSAEPR